MPSKGVLPYPDFPDQVYTLPTIRVGSHRVTFIAQGDDDAGKAAFVDNAISRMRQSDRIKYPGLHEPEE